MAKAKRSAARALEWLVVEGAEVVAVVAGEPDELTRDEQRVDLVAERHGLAARVRRGAVRARRRSDVDLVISFLFWKRIREPLLSLGRIGCLNFHPAPLPDMRGVGGYNVAVLEGMSEWGVSCHFVDADFDTGDIVEVERFPIDPDTATALSRGPGQPGAPVRAVQARDAPRARRRGAAAHAAGRGPVRDRARSSRSCARVRPGDDLDRKLRAFWYPPYPGRPHRGRRPRPDARGRKAPCGAGAALYREGGLGALTSLAHDLRGLRNRESGRGALLHELRHRARAALPDLRHARAARGALLHELRRHARRALAPAAPSPPAAPASRRRSRPRSAAR